MAKYRKRETLTFELLENRKLLTANAPLFGGLPATGTDLPSSPTAEVIADDFGLDDQFLAEQAALRAQDPRVAIALPTEFTDELRVEIEVNGETQTLVLERAISTRDDGFQVLVQLDDGTLVEFDAGEEANYVGYVEERQGIRVRAVFSSRGITAEARHSNGEFAWSITPADETDANGLPLHTINFSDVFAQLEANHDHDGDGIADHAAGEHVDPQPDGPHGPGCSCEACTAAALGEDVSATGAATLPGDTSIAAETLPPVAASLAFTPAPSNPASRALVFNEVQVRQATIGFDVTNEAFRDGYGSNINAVLDNIALFLTTDESVSPSTTSPASLYLRDGLVQQVAGTIIIRTSLAADPYAGQNGSAAGDADINSGLLNQFRDRWNANVDDNLADQSGFQRFGDVNRSQSDHDLVTLLGGSAGTFGGAAIDGLAFVGTVNETNRYSIADGTNADFWRGVARHEIGHTFGLPHFGGSGRRAEFDPAGNGIGIFDPTGLRNALTTDERAVVQAEVESSGLALVNPFTPGVSPGTFTEHDLRPVAARDDVSTDGAEPLIIDVLANDFDGNNDALFLASFQGITEAGGTVEVLVGGGDQGQDVLVYTAPEGFTGVDSFFYQVDDVEQIPSTVSVNNGLVTIDVNPPAADPLTAFQFDFGPNTGGAFSGNTVAGQSLPANLTSNNNFFNAVDGSDVDFTNVLDSEGNASGVTLTLRETPDGSAFNFDAPGNTLGSRTFNPGDNATGIYDTPLLNDLIFTNQDDDLGLRLEGLAQGTYQITAILQETLPSATSRTYSIDIGAGSSSSVTFGDFGEGNVTTAPASAPPTFVDNQNFYTETIQVLTGEAVFVLIDSLNDQFVTLQALQVVQLSEEVTLPVDPLSAFQFDFGPNTGGAFTGTSVAGQSLPANLTSNNNFFNAVDGSDVDFTDVLDSEGNASGVTLTLRETPDGSAFNFDAPGNTLGSRTLGGADNPTGIYDTPLLNDLIFTNQDDDLGLRLEGLAQGTYQITAILQETLPSATSRTYSIDIGAGSSSNVTFGDFGEGNVTTAPASAPPTFVDNQNFYTETIEVLNGEAVFVLIDSLNDQFVTLQALQVVQLTAPEVVPGDFNGDGFVGLPDFTAFRDLFGSSSPLLNETASPGAVDAADFEVFVDNFGATGPDAAQQATSAALEQEPEATESSTFSAEQLPPISAEVNRSASTSKPVGLANEPAIKAATTAHPAAFEFVLGLDDKLDPADESLADLLLTDTSDQEEPTIDEAFSQLSLLL